MTDDLDGIMAVMEVAFDPAWGEAWNRRQISDSLAFASTHYRLIDKDGHSPPQEGAPVGFTLVRAAPGEEELLLIAVHPCARGRGLGRALLQCAADDARARGAGQVFLEMRENNPAKALYLQFGFRPIGMRKDYYSGAGGMKLNAITFAYAL